MPYTNAELQAIYAQLNIGAAGSAADQATVIALATQTRIGQLSDAEALEAVYDLVDDTTGVAAVTYQFFTGSLPTEAGFQFLVNSATNPNDLNDPYYAQFNLENRLINFSLNLALGTPANQTAFAATYGGATTLEQALGIAYETIIGRANAEARGIDVDAAIDFLSNDANVAFYRQIAIERGGFSAADPVRLDLAIKAIAIAELLNAAISEDVGNYAASLNQFYGSLSDATPGSDGFGEDLLETFPPSATVTLTENPDTLVGNVFNAPRGFTPGGTDQVNTLNDDDVLTGVGDNPTLNFTFVNDADTGDTDVTPTLNGIETINVDVRLDSSGTLDLQDATGVTNINLDGIDDGNDFTVDNIQSLVDVSITDSNAPSSEVDIAFDEDAVDGGADASTLTLDEVELDIIYYQEEGGAKVDNGIEDLTIVLEGESEIGALFLEDVQKIAINGEGSLDLGSSAQVINGSGNVEAEIRSGGLANVAGSLALIDASAMTGDLNINLGAEVVANKDNTSGVEVDFVFKGGSGDDQVWVLGGIDSKADSIDTGAGDDTIGVYASIANGTITNAESLLVHVSSPTGSTAITVDTGLFTGLEDVTIRNIGSKDNAPVGDGELDPENNPGVVTLNKLSAAVAAAITVQHGTTGNNGIGDLTVNTAFKTTTASDTVGVTIDEGVNVDPRFNFTLSAASAENVTLNDIDTESNSVLLTNLAGHTGTLKITGGQEGNFLNLDVGGIYALDLSGDDVDAPPGSISDGGAQDLIFKTIDAGTFVGDLYVRIGEVDANITTGSGNDTIVFDVDDDSTAGLSISDTVNAGAGYDTVALDGEYGDLDGVINIGASEWENFSGVDAILLVDNDLGTYKLTLTNELVDQTDDGGVIDIINDNDPTNTGAFGNPSAVVIDARDLSSQNTFTYDGEEAANVTADRFIMSDANINGTAVIDGGWADKIGGASGDTLEVRNGAVITLGDLKNVSNVGTIEFTNDTATDQESTLVLDNATVERLVNNQNTAKAGQEETLTINIFGNPVVVGPETIVTIDAEDLTNPFLLLDINVNSQGKFVLVDGSATTDIDGDADANDITGGGGNDNISGNAGNDTLNGGAGDDTINGGADDDTLNGNDGDDVMNGGTGFDVQNGGAGADTFDFTPVTDSSGIITAGGVREFDFVVGLNWNEDQFDVAAVPTAIVAAAAGAASAATFNADIDAILTTAAVNEAQIVTANAGDLIGRSFFVQDVDGDGTFDVGTDLIVEITGFTGTLTVADFI